eukprot:1159630-Pelagomonas_calceolata.AAC.2
MGKDKKAAQAEEETGDAGSYDAKIKFCSKVGWGVAKTSALSLAPQADLQAACLGGYEVCVL